MQSKHFDCKISYKGSSLDIHVQCLSTESPLIYAVWPKDVELKQMFDNTYVLFSKSIKPSEEILPTTWHQVHYSKNVKSTDLDFELAVWNELDNI